MPASYPGSIPAKPSINTSDMSAGTSHSVDRGLQWDEIRAVCQELGTTPSGPFSTVKLRLEDIEADIATINTDFMPKTGGAFSGQVSCTVSAPVSASHLTRKDYVDTKASLTGDTFTGPINGTSAVFSAAVQIDGAINHDGTTAGFMGATPVTVRTLGAAATDPATTQTLAKRDRDGTAVVTGVEPVASACHAPALRIVGGGAL
jgi:hypothetical protein